MISYRHEAIWILWDSEGWTYHMIAEAFHLSERKVKELIKDNQESKKGGN